MSRKVMEQLVILERCCLVPIRRNSVLAGFTERRFELSQEWMLSRVEDRTERLSEKSEGGKRYTAECHRRKGEMKPNS